MATQDILGLDGSVPTAEPTSRTEPALGAIITARATKFLAIVRVVVGFTFLWAFLDKTFGLGYATPAARAWINGGSPTKGFLSRVAVGPFESTFHAWAGAAWGRLAVHARPARYRHRADPRGRAAGRGRQRHRDDAADVGGGVAA
jgi:hypothetical protein